MLTAQCQQLYELQKKAWFIVGKKTPGNSRAIEVILAVLEVKTDYSSNGCLSQMKSPKLKTEIIQPLTEREVESDRAMQTLDSKGCQKGNSQPIVLRDSYVASEYHPKCGGLCFSCK